MKAKHIEVTLANYNAAREEILFRQKAQQDLIRYSILVAGLIGPILGLGSVIDPWGLLAVLLVGPVICVFIQAVYLKHQLYLELLANYINAESTTLPKECRPLGWDEYFKRTLFQHRGRDFLSSLLGFAEGSFSILIGGLYLLASALAAQFYKEPLSFRPLNTLGTFFLIDVILLCAFVVAGVLLRRWTVRLRYWS